MMSTLTVPLIKPFGKVARNTPKKPTGPLNWKDMESLAGKKLKLENVEFAVIETLTVFPAREIDSTSVLDGVSGVQ